MSRVRMGIVGIGNMGGAHATTLFGQKIPEMELAALCDIDPGKRAWARERFPGVPVYKHAEELLGSGLADAVLVATPHYFHAPIAIAALERGLHVLSEKPEGVYTRQAEELNRAAAAHRGQVFGIMFNQRTNPLFQKARELVQSGRLGVPKRLVWIVTNWYRNQAYYDSGGWRATWRGEGGGVLLNQAPHNLDLWQWIFGMPLRVRAFLAEGKYHHIEVEDDATLYAEYENGATATFITTTGEHPGTNRLELSGDRGKAVLEDGKLRCWELPAPEREFCFRGETPEPRYWEYVPTSPETAHAGILQNFASAVLHGTPLLAPGEEGIRELTLSNAAYLSSWTDSWVTLPLDKEAFERELFRRVEQSRARDGQVVEEKNDGSYKNRWSVRW